MLNILSYGFMQNAIMTAVIVSVICGLIGPFIVTKKMVFISGGLSHSAFGGLGIAYWLGINPLYGALVFVLAAAVGLGFKDNVKNDNNDIFIGILWATGMATGIVFIHMTPGYAPNLMTFLFGNILTVSSHDLHIIFVLFCVVVSVVIIFFKGFTAVALDEEYAKVRKLPVRLLNIGLLILIALSIVALIQVVGIILVIALLTIPVAIAEEFSSDFKKIMVISILFGILICITGLVISYFIEFPSGASIILTGSFFLGVIKLIKKILFRPGAKHDNLISTDQNLNYASLSPGYERKGKTIKGE